MASPAFFNENGNRAYPFVPSDNSPPNTLVVDAGFIVGPKTRFKTGVHRIWLAAVRRQASYFYFDFQSDAPELYGLALTFSRHVTDPDFYVEFLDSGTSGLSESSESGSTASPYACEEPLWSGFLTTGKAESLTAALPTDGVIACVGVVEPGLIQNLAESFVVKFAVANDDRTRVQPALGCGEIVDTSNIIHIKSNCVVGDVVFVPGYNANVRQSSTDNSITIGAAVGDGAGEPCTPVELYDGEAPAENSTLLEGGPRCNETIRSINGAGGPQLNLIAGKGVTITGSPEDNRVIINVNMSGLALCFDSISARSESC